MTDLSDETIREWMTTVTVFNNGSEEHYRIRALGQALLDTRRNYEAALTDYAALLRLAKDADADNATLVALLQEVVVEMKASSGLTVRGMEWVNRAETVLTHSHPGVTLAQS